MLHLLSKFFAGFKSSKIIYFEWILKVVKNSVIKLDH